MELMKYGCMLLGHKIVDNLPKTGENRIAASGCQEL